MKKIITTTIAAGLVAGVASAGVSTSFDVASAYVFRGVTLNDGPVFQPGIEASDFGLPEEYGAVSFGAWANYDIDDYGGTLDGGNFSEIDWYGSYSLPAFVEGLDLFVGYCEYTYPLGGEVAPGVAYPADKEVNFGAGYEVAGVGLGLTYYYGLDGGIKKSSYIELTAGYGMDFTEELSGSVDGSIAFADIDGGESGLANYTIGASVGYALSEKWSAGASVTYIGQGDDKVLPEAPGAYDVSVVGMLSLACEM